MGLTWFVTVEQIDIKDVDSGDIDIVWRVTTKSPTGTKSISVASKIEDVGDLVVKLMVSAVQNLISTEE